MKPRWNPALTTLAFVVGLVAAAGVLSWATHAGSGTDTDLVDSGPFQAWIGVAALTVVAFVDTLVAGIRELRNERLRSSAPPTWVNVLVFGAFAVIVVLALQVGGRGGPSPDIDHWVAVRMTLLLLGVAAACPWIVSVWAAHAELTEQRRTIPALPAVAAVEPDETEDLDRVMALLLDIRKDIAAAVTRLLVLVMGAVLTSGALHAALVPDHVSEEDFPQSAVLVYGAFFSLMLALAVVPLMRSWRSTATMLADQAYPRRVATSADDAAARDRMVAAFDLNGSLFTSPVTLSAVLAPLITSLLAVFVPQIGS